MEINTQNNKGKLFVYLSFIKMNHTELSNQLNEIIFLLKDNNDISVSIISSTIGIIGVIIGIFITKHLNQTGKLKVYTSKIEVTNYKQDSQFGSLMECEIFDKDRSYSILKIDIDIINEKLITQFMRDVFLIINNQSTHKMCLYQMESEHKVDIKNIIIDPKSLKNY